MEMSLIVDQVDAGSEPVRTAILEEKELYWLAGILDGEGSFIPGPPSDSNAPRIQCGMTDEDTIAKISKIFGTKYHKIKSKQKDYFKDAWVVSLRGYRAMSLMRRLRPIMSSRRQTQIDVALGSFDSDRADRALARLTKVSEEQIEEMRARHSSGESLRSIGKVFGLDHETVRQRINNGPSKYLKLKQRLTVPVC